MNSSYYNLEGSSCFILGWSHPILHSTEYCNPLIPGWIHPGYTWMGSSCLYLDEVILPIPGRGHPAYAWMGSSCLYLDEVILPIPGWGHPAYTWTRSSWLYLEEVILAIPGRGHPGYSWTGSSYVIPGRGHPMLYLDGVILCYTWTGSSYFIPGRSHPGDVRAHGPDDPLAEHDEPQRDAESPVQGDEDGSPHLVLLDDAVLQTYENVNTFWTMPSQTYAKVYTFWTMTYCQHRYVT